MFSSCRAEPPQPWARRAVRARWRVQQVLVGLAPLIGAGRDDRLAGRQREARLDDRSIHGLAERVGFKPTVRLPVQRFSSLRFLMWASAVPAIKRVLWLGIFPTSILSCDAWYRAVSCGSFANPFANSQHQPMSAYPAIADFHEAQSHDRLTQSGRHSRGQIWTLTVSEHALLGRRTAASAPKLSGSLRQRLRIARWCSEPSPRASGIFRLGALSRASNCPWHHFVGHGTARGILEA